MYTPGASNFVESVDWVFKFIIGISLFFLILITGTMIYFVIRYNRKKHPKAEQIKDNMKLELTWIVIPIILVIFMFYYGYSAFEPMVWVPRNAMQVKVIGKMWQWSYEYPGGRESDVLVLPVNKPVKLNLYSQDVIHGFFIPDFRVKEDVVPGKNNYMWFTPGKIGEYEILCTAYCGLRHSYMGSKARIVSEDDFKKWLTTLPTVASEAPGLAIIKKNACTGCHSLNGSKLVGPTFKGLFGSTVTVTTDGKEHKMIADSSYLITSIYDPDKDIVNGFPRSLMRTYTGKITPDETRKIIEYLKTLK